jgi:Alkylmercury lyase
VDPGGGNGAPGQAGRGCLAPAGGGLRAAQQQVLRSFAATGHPPAASGLAELAARYGTTAGAVLAELHAADFLQLGPGGDIHAAYPFSAVPTSHVVRIDGGPRVHAMCAIDALGIAAMLGAAVRIISADPCTSEPVTIIVQVDGKTATWQPPAAVVFTGQRTSYGSHGARSSTPAIAPAAEVCCRYMNFFATPASAAAWASLHPEVTGQVRDQTTALRLGVAIFGHLLTDAC